MTTDNRTNEPIVAAAGAAPQAEGVIDGRCQTCGGEVFEGDAAEVVEHLAAPVQPSSTVDVEKVIDALVMTDLSDYAGTDMGMIRSAALAVVEAIGGESRG